MINHMKTAIAHAETRTTELNAKRERPMIGMAAGWTDTPHGELKVNFIVAEGVTTYTPRHLRKSWTLNGKRIAAKKLEALV